MVQGLCKQQIKAYIAFLTSSKCQKVVFYCTEDIDHVYKIMFMPFYAIKLWAMKNMNVYFLMSHTSFERDISNL